MSGESPILNIRPMGAAGLLLEARDYTDVPAIAAAIHSHIAEGLTWRATDVVPAARTVLLSGLTRDPEVVAREIATWSIPPLPTDAGDLVTLPVVFDGPDLTQVAQFWDTTADAVVTRLRDLEFRVAFSGFAPGFAYLTGLPDELAVPRRQSPRTRVPAGSIGLAGRYCGVYPRESPGGWQLVGRVVQAETAGATPAADTALWDLERDPPALLTPGTRVRLSDE